LKRASGNSSPIWKRRNRRRGEKYLALRRIVRECLDRGGMNHAQQRHHLARLVKGGVA
jgi:hypothetical protein